MACAASQRLTGRQAVDQTHAAVAKFPQPVGCSCAKSCSRPSVSARHRPRRRGARARVAAQQPLVAQRAPGLALGDQRVGQRLRRRPGRGSGPGRPADAPCAPHRRAAPSPAPHTGVGRRQLQRPGGALAGRAAAPGGAAGGLVQRAFERRAVERQQPFGARRRHRPDQRERAPGGRSVERQQRQHVGRSGTTGARRRRAARRDASRAAIARVAVGMALEAHAAARRATPSPCLRDTRAAAASGIGVERAARAARSAAPAPALRRAPAASTIQASASTPCAPRREVAACAPRVAVDVHVVHRGAASAGSASQTLQLLQQRVARRVERIGAHVGARRARGVRRAQRHAQSLSRPAPAPGSATTPAPRMPTSTAVPSAHCRQRRMRARGHGTIRAVMSEHLRLDHRPVRLPGQVLRRRRGGPRRC